MHGREGEKKKRQRHMCPDPAPGAATTIALAVPRHPAPSAVAAAADFNHCSPDYFLKDGRRIYVGDCALFQAGNSPPFIGIIRCLSPDKEDNLKLGVNWLYRPSDVKLAKGILLEAAPNEIFYSFHKDEISAQSLLHPCKVAFLSKGVELPSGISSFVCRQVYDIANKCLWWLTDRDYINEHQEEVDQLLDKTRLEMHAAVQSGGRSPKPLNGASTQQLKSGSDNVQNNSSPFASQAKGKKRGEKGDQSSESKREHSSNADDKDLGNLRPDSMIKTEIAKITDKGGLINSDSVEKFVQLMQLDRGERKIDLAGQLLLADVIAATDKNDCLVKFVQLRGVPVLDNWLHEAHKGKNGDGSSPKEGDKSVEELLLALLRALDRLPVNLNALQTCNIGKSVNHLRSHKNLEIQKKARSLVDTWKKRVDAEMTKLEMTKLSDAKSLGSQTAPWPGKSCLSEFSHGGNRRAGSSEIAVRSSFIQPTTCKSLPVKIGHGDSTVKPNPSTSGSMKWSTTLSSSVAIGGKDTQSRTGGNTGDAVLPPTMIKEEKSSNSCQLQNNSQSNSNDHAKTVGTSWREDTRSSTAGLTNASRTSGSASRHRKSSYGLTGTVVSNAADGSFGKSSSLNRGTTSEKAPPSVLTGERSADMSTADHGNSHRLIVRLPNPGRSPARSTGGGSLEDPLTGSIASSPGIGEKNEPIDRTTKAKSDVYQAYISTDVHTESWQTEALKGMTGSDDDGRSPAPMSKPIETGKEVDVVAEASEPNTKLFQASLSSINALIESVKYSETGTSSYSGDDDLGMNLLASVAAGEMSKSNLVSPSDSPGENTVAEHPCIENEVKSKLLSDDVATQAGQPVDNVQSGSEKCASADVALQDQDEMQPNGADHYHANNSFGDSKCILHLEKTDEHRELCPASVELLNAKSECKPGDAETDGCASSLTLQADIKEDGCGKDSAYQLVDKPKATKPVTDGLPDCKRKVRNPSSNKSKSVDCLRESIAEGSIPLYDRNDINHADLGGGKCEMDPARASSPLNKQNVVDDGLRDSISTEQQLPATMAVCSDVISRNVDRIMPASTSATCSEVVDELKIEKSDSMLEKNPLESSDKKRNEKANLAAPIINERTDISVLSTSNCLENLQKMILKHNSTASAGHEEPPIMPPCESEECAKSMGSKLSAGKAGVEKTACSMEATSAVISVVQDTSAKCDFDLNEGLSVDEGSPVGPVSSSLQGYTSTVHLPNLPLFTVSPLSSGSLVSITVAAPAKGPFVPPESLLKIKREAGWKGSAATSAFRPAEPRKVPEMPVGTTDIPEMPVGTTDVPSSDAAAGKLSHLPLDIDLNVADERVLEDAASQRSTQESGGGSRVVRDHDSPMRKSGGLDLDLNRADESIENGQMFASTSQSLEVPHLPVRSTSGGLPLGEASVLRDFDLNSGPSLDVGVEQLPQGQHTKNSTVPFLPSLGMKDNELGNLSSWFSPGHSYPAVAIPSFLPDRGDQAFPIIAASGTQRIFGSSTGGDAFGSDLYRGSLLTSSPAMAFSPAAAFSYPGFSFGPNFPLASASFSGGLTTYVDSASGGGPCFPAIPTPLMGPVGSAASPYVRPFVISLPDRSNSGGLENSRKWGQQGLDLNAGAGSIDDRLTSRQLPVASSQALAEEQARMYQAAVGGLKRKEPEGGWDAERLSCRAPSWQ